MDKWTQAKATANVPRLRTKATLSALPDSAGPGAMEPWIVGSGHVIVAINAG